MPNPQLAEKSIKDELVFRFGNPDCEKECGCHICDDIKIILPLIERHALERIIQELDEALNLSVFETCSRIDILKKQLEEYG